MNSELMLLIDYDKAKLFELYVLLQQRNCADDNINSSAADLAQKLRSLFTC